LGLLTGDEGLKPNAGGAGCYVVESWEIINEMLIDEGGKSYPILGEPSVQMLSNG
jgi:hypothetical protein